MAAGVAIPTPAPASAVRATWTPAASRPCRLRSSPAATTAAGAAAQSARARLSPALATAAATVAASVSALTVRSAAATCAMARNTAVSNGEALPSPAPGSGSGSTATARSRLQWVAAAGAAGGGPAMTATLAPPAAECRAWKQARTAARYATCASPQAAANVCGPAAASAAAAAAAVAAAAALIRRAFDGGHGVQPGSAAALAGVAPSGGSCTG